MPCVDLVPAPADYGGYCDASKAGAGGVWFGLEKNLPAIMWHVEFPAEIQSQLISFDNPKGSNSDLEMAGLLLQWMALENFAMCMLHVGATIHQQCHGHPICWPPRQQKQHIYCTSWHYEWLHAMLPHWPPVTLQEIWTKWPALHHNHLYPAQTQNNF